MGTPGEMADEGSCMCARVEKSRGANSSSCSGGGCGGWLHRVGRCSTRRSVGGGRRVRQGARDALSWVAHGGTRSGRWKGCQRSQAVMLS